MLELKIGVHLKSLRLPFKAALRAAAELKVDAVEIDARGEMNPRDISDTGYRQLRKLLDDYNLKVSAVGFYTRRGYNVEADLDRRIEATKQAMEFAYRLGCRVVVNYIGQIPESPESAGWELLLATLSDLGRFGQRAGATLAARTGAEQGQRLAELIDALPQGSIGVDFDPGGLIVNGFSATEAMQQLARHVIHFHARDGVRDLAQGRGLETPLGQGAADFPELLGILEQQDYQGFLTLERETAREPLVDLNNAVKYLRNL